MKSSTIRRSTLSKETMEVIENLAKEQEESGIPGEYVRPDEIDNGNNGMTQEIDLLWQNFKTNQFNTNSPVLYITIGIVIGVILTSLSILGFNAVSAHKASTNSGKSTIFGVEKVKDKTPEPTLEEQTNINQEGVKNNIVPPAEINESDSSDGNYAEGTENMTKYKVKSGDTIESIIKHHYGTYSPDKAELIMKVNNMPTLDRINIDQEILLP